MELGIVENGQEESINLVETDNKDKPFRAVWMILMAILINFCLMALSVPLYLYLNSVNEVVKQRLMDYILVGGALIGIPMLYRLGDLSKGRPNFYYI
ncbi:uncharacterized protein LOC120453788 [Drosophila santomea]|uniref:uncharacterized protein LOC120453788 n=1 Tax=Drosophila santomea TaxID=129105 RepID=UPI0019536A09|nr:uncharacterized protein LOC120453788 [Drosophila santomea]XP_039494574.1 uncharacterized protein LOC120453788 [Drosophila santomea]